MAAFTAGRQEPMRGAELNPVGGAPEPPKVYFSTAPNHCYPIEGLEYWIFVHSSDDADFTSISLDLDLQGRNVLPALITPESGVTLDVVDVSSLPFHVEASWTSRPLDNEPIAKVQFFVDPELYDTQRPVNVVFTRGGGATEPGVGVWSWAGCCIDCFPCGLGLSAESIFRVPVVGSATSPFEWWWNCWSAGGVPVTASDSEGWVVSWTPTVAGDIATCGMCFVPLHWGSVEVSVPAGVAPGTTSTLTIAAMENTETVLLVADDTIPVEHTTWGAVKALYR
jgi:hypothetical protein